MNISCEQIKQWAFRPVSLLPRLTIDIVTAALEGAPQLRWQAKEIYLQGSWANKTNIDPDCDVDLVIQLTSPFEEKLDLLSLDEQTEFFEHYGYTHYGWQEFRADVHAALKRSHFVERGKRCLTISDLDALWRVPADILPALEYRRYQAFPSLVGELYDEGVYFLANEIYPIVNYPKLHLLRGNQKDTKTGGRFKQIVRVTKNLRRFVKFKGAPSYFVECLLFNVPALCYRNSLCQAVEEVVKWLVQHNGDLGDMLCQNGIVPMFGDHAEAWDVDEARRFVRALGEAL